MPLLSKRSFIKSLFVAPAIVAASNIMPVKAVQLFTTPTDTLIKPGIYTFEYDLSHRQPAKLITDLAEIQEASHTIGEWKLVEIAGGERRWLSAFNAERLKYKYDVIKTMEVPQSPREIDTTVALMKADPGSAVIWELPYGMRSF